MTAAQREALILDAAEQVLLARGLQGLTMERVAQCAGMSKRTLYEHFLGREPLMAALVTRLRGAVIQPLTPAQTARPLAERLHLLLDPQAETETCATALEVLRAVVAEAPQHPELAARFLEDGPRAVRRMIRDELDRAVARGEIGLTDTQAAAALLHGMALTCPLEAFLATDAPAADAAARSAHVARAIAVFLRGAGAL
ncbi:TetR/AcrR family transcriptional regulator [Rhodovulum bhavnagarense]|nr:TetR/AcrR family transcriptional regulator [Rhodovulum bhavnagarense]